VNDTPREKTYILDEDRSLDGAWLTSKQDQVNLTRNGRGELSIRVHPPANAEPGDYPFGITVGPQGGVLTQRNLVLSVQATPAVKVTAKANVVKVGGLTKDVVFPLTVESIGNADTAFRIAVKALPGGSETDGEEGPRGPGDVYETAQWRYVFDKELDTLRTPSSGQAPHPVAISLRIRRKGIWWFGGKETHTVRVAAVPVTEPGNGGKPGNSVELTAVRWRIVPFPYLLLLPILLIFMAFGSKGADTVALANSVWTASSDTSNAAEYYVVRNGSNFTADNTGSGGTISDTLQWKAPPYALLRISMRDVTDSSVPTQTAYHLGGGSLPISAKVSNSLSNVEYDYTITNLSGGSGQEIDVHYVYNDDTVSMQLADNHHRTYNGSSATIFVPPGSSGIKLLLGNGSSKATSLNVWLVGLSQTSTPFNTTYSKGTFVLPANYPVGTENNTYNFPITWSDSSSSPEDYTFVLITNDSRRPVIQVHLKAGS
jgi:hypothetical protein